MPTPPHSRFALGLSLAVIAAYLVASYAGGADSYVRINDNLDFIVPVYVSLAEQPLFGPLDSQVSAPMGGIPRNSLVSALNFGVLPYFVLEPLQALAWNEIVIRLVAFAGMLALLRRRVLPEASDLVVHGTATGFALLPFLAVGHLSVAGQPWLLYSVLNLREGRGRSLDWLAVIVFPLYSSLVYVGAFVLLGLGLLWLHDLWRQRRLPPALTVSVVLMGLLFAASEYRLIYQTLFQPDYVSERTEWAFRGRPFLVAGYNAALSFLFNQHHAAAAQFPVLLGAVAAAGGLLLGRRRRASREERFLALQLGLFVGLALGISGFVVLYNWQPVQDLLDTVPLATAFGFHRLEWFHPLLFSLAFAVALEAMGRRGAWGVRAVAGVLVLQLGVLAWHSDAWRERRESGLTFREYYSPRLFEEVRDHIGRPASEYRVASLGLNPGIALYNGLQVAGGVTPNYPLDYKYAFRPVIAQELERDEPLRKHYDDWGVHVHLYSTELGMVAGYRKRAYYTKDGPLQAVRDLRIDTRALAELGNDYVLSSVAIENHAELGLAPDGVFERADSPWRLHLYRIL